MTPAKTLTNFLYKEQTILNVYGFSDY